MLLIVLVYLAGVLFNRVVGKNLPAFFVLSSGLLTGFALWLISAIVILLTGSRLSLIYMIVAYFILVAFLIYYGFRQNVFNSSFLYLLLISAILIAGVSLFFIINNYSTGFFDSLLLITQGKNLVPDGLSDFYESSPRGFGIFIPILQSGSIYCNVPYLTALQPLMSISFVVTFIFLTYHSAIKIYSSRKILWIVVSLFTLFLITNQFVVFNFPLILTNFPSAIYLFVSISTYWLFIREKNKCWIVFTILSLIAFSLSRAEGPVFGLVFLAIILSEKTLSYTDRLKISIPYLAVIILWYSRLFFIEAVKYDIVSSEIVLAIAGVHLFYLVFIIFSNLRFFESIQLRLHWIILFSLSLFYLIYILINPGSGWAYINNIMLPMFIWGGWGFFYIFIFMFFLLAYFQPDFTHERPVVYTIVIFYLLLLIMQVVNGAYRISGPDLNQWSGSGNRMSIHIVPLVIYYFVLKFGSLFNTSQTYIIYYSWENTANNHAGMAYLVKQIKNAYPENIRLIKVPGNWNSWNSRIKKAWHMLSIIYFKFFMRKNDRILFMEFLGNRSGDQVGLASKLRKSGLKSKFSGLVHLSPSNLEELYGNESYITKSLQALDNILVFGTSLQEYFIKLGFRDKIKRTFHYIDTDYYHPSLNKETNQRLKVISMGSLKRNHELLKEIVMQCPFADFDICTGGKEHSDLFRGIRNVTLYGYVPEETLLRIMQHSDVSLSVLHDTVGSNVIVTSLATGLVNVVSDVGSVRDYCGENESFLCAGEQDFIYALNKLNNEKDLLSELSKRSIEKANNFNLRKFLGIFPELIN